MEAAMRKRVCQLVAGIIITDDILEPAEEAFLDRVLLRFGFAAEGRDAIFPLVNNLEAAEATRELSPEVQEQAFALLKEAALADGTVAPEELEYLRAVGRAMGMSDDTLEARLKELEP
jgi:uncharacterized tellurite resistance protein B-like protein